MQYLPDIFHSNAVKITVPSCIVSWFLQGHNICDPTLLLKSTSTQQNYGKGEVIHSNSFDCDSWSSDADNPDDSQIRSHAENLVANGHWGKFMQVVTRSLQAVGGVCHLRIKNGTGSGDATWMFSGRQPSSINSFQEVIQVLSLSNLLREAAQLSPTSEFTDQPNPVLLWFVPWLSIKNDAAFWVESRIYYCLIDNRIISGCIKDVRVRANDFQSMTLTESEQLLQRDILTKYFSEPKFVGMAEAAKEIANRLIIDILVLPRSQRCYIVRAKEESAAFSRSLFTEGEIRAMWSKDHLCDLGEWEYRVTDLEGLASMRSSSLTEQVSKEFALALESDKAMKNSFSA